MNPGNIVPGSLVSTSAQAAATPKIILNQAQSNQLMGLLKQGNVQTFVNPTTGDKKRFIITSQKNCVAIPLQPTSGSQVVTAAPNITLSPIKQQTPVQTLPQQSASRTIRIGAQQRVSQTTAVKSQPQSQLVLSQQQSAVTPHKTSHTLLASSPQVSTPTFSSPSTMESMISRSGTKRSDIDFETFSESKRRKTDKDKKGLRHFSMKVCEKVKAKGVTTYNEVAEELVQELTDPTCQSPSDDQKNIKRRVYDALNVLMAMNIIVKEKKVIKWVGLPTNSVQEAYGLESEKSKRIERIKEKTRQLQELIIQQIAFKNLVERNKDQEKRVGEPTPNSSIQLPFIIVSTKKDTVVDVQINNDKSEWLFDFNDVFETHDDMEVLRRMEMDLGLQGGAVSEADLEKAVSMVPKALEPYVVQLAKHGKGSCNMPAVGKQNCFFLGTFLMKIFFRSQNLFNRQLSKKTQEMMMWKEMKIKLLQTDHSFEYPHYFNSSFKDFSQ